MSGWRETVLNLLFPPKCAFCGALLAEGEEGVCRRCLGDLPRLENPESPHRESWGRWTAVFFYEGTVKAGIRSYKFQGRLRCAPVFARYLAQTAAERFGGEFDAVTYIPVSRKRLRERGYDQSGLLAKEMAALWDVQAEVTLEKVRHTPAQSTLSGAARRENPRNVFRVIDQEKVSGRRFLLVDDVLTTGSTMAEGAGALRRAGAADVVCLALAAPRR